MGYVGIMNGKFDGAVYHLEREKSRINLKLKNSELSREAELLELQRFYYVCRRLDDLYLYKVEMEGYNILTGEDMYD